MQNKAIILTLAAGFLSAGLFLLVAGMGLGFFFLFLPSLPLFLAGLGWRAPLALHGGAIAVLIIAVVATVPVAVMFLLLLALPVWYIARQSLLWREDGAGGRLWFPLGLAFTRLALYACAVMIAVALYYIDHPEGLAEVMSRTIREAFSGVDEEYSQAVTLLAGPWSFLIFALPAWLWTLSLFAFGWLAHYLLKRKGRNIRPDFAVTLFPTPHWLLGLLIACAVMSLAGGPSLSFLGKAMMVALLLPYFLLGMAWVHMMSASWPSRRFFLFFIYLLIFAQFWPALIASGLGLFYHIKHLSARPDSTRN